MINRIQRLFLSEYRSLDDMVLVESPFAETTKEGIGIRQVHIGLTPTKLIIAADLLPEATAGNASAPKTVDPRTETLELLTICGVECVTLSIYHRKKRQTLKAHFCNKTTAYYELGGFVMRHSYWNLWCERVKYLNPDCEIVRSCSETSAASSTTCSTQYLLGKTCGAGEGGVQIPRHSQERFRHHERRQLCLLDRNNTRAAWTERDIYLGEELEVIRPQNYKPAQPNYLEKEKSEPELTFIYRKPPKNKKQRAGKLKSAGSSEECACFPVECKDSSVYRFAEGVNEHCLSALRLRVEPPPPVEQHSLLQKPSPNDLRHLRPLSPPCPPAARPAELADQAVELWERGNSSSCRNRRMKHMRRYALTPRPHLLNGLGPWPLAHGERYSVQVKRAVSCIRIRRGNIDPSLMLSLPHRLLTATVSSEHLPELRGQSARQGTRFAVQSEPAMLFWTPNLWYRPRRGHEAYVEQRTYLRTLPDNLANIYASRNKGGLCGYFKSRRTKKSTKKWMGPYSVDSGRETDGKEDIPTLSHKLTSIFCFARTKVNSKISAGCNALSTTNIVKDQPLKSVHPKTPDDICKLLKKALRIRKPFNAWNFDSTMLAYQLTMTDKKLFLKLTPRELATAIWSQTSKDSPNLIAIIAFAHRVTCLVTSSILAEDDLRRRARLIARFIYTADKCNQIHNFQSCYSVLAGLQSPPCFRLRKTWSHVRKKHAQMHDLFEKLCKLYRDPRLPAFQRAFHLASRTAPYLPYIGHMLSSLLDRLPEIDIRYLNCPSSYRLPIKPIGDSLSIPTQIGTHSGCGATNEEGMGDHANDSEIRNRIMSALKMGVLQSCGSSFDDLLGLLEPSASGGNWLQYPQGCTDMDILENYVQFFQPIVEDNRIQKLEEVTEVLDLAQKAAEKYSLKVDPDAGEFLYKARYREDKENFIISISVEP